MKTTKKRSGKSGVSKRGELPTSITALGVRQPWAHCIIFKGKNVENRSQNLKKRGTIAIYATNSKGSLDRALNHGLDPDKLVRGAVVGFVDVVAVITKREVTAKTKKWFIGEYGYVLSRPIRLKRPVPVSPPSGAVKFWQLKGAPLRKCLRQLSRAQIKRLVAFS